MEDSQVSADFAAFPVHMGDPKAAAEKRKKEQQQQKQTPLSKAQLQAAEKMTKEQEERTHTSKKRDLVRKTQQYVKEFAEGKGKRIDYKLPRGFGTKMPLEELQAIHDEVVLELSSTGGAQYLASMYVGALGLLQDHGHRVKLKLAGPNADMRGTLGVNTDQWMPVIKELGIKYERYFAVGPEKRLLFLTARLVTMVHEANTRQAAPNAPATQEEVEELDAIFG